MRLLRCLTYVSRKEADAAGYRDYEEWTLTKRWILHTMIISCALAPIRASAETYEQSYIRLCGNGSAIAALSRQYNRADALLEDNRFAIAKKLAAELYDCSTTVADPYEKDIAKYFSLQFLEIGSLTLKQDAEHIAYEFNELAANTRFPDIRKMSLKSRDYLRTQE